MVWFKRFPNPILLPNGRRLHSLQDASDHIALLPQAERDQIDWQVAMEALVIAAERDGDVFMAWTSVVRALNRGIPSPAPKPPEPPSPKPPRFRVVN